MSLNFSPIRLIIFVACVLAFWAFGGFEYTVPGPEGTRVELGGAWIRPLVTFFVGAIAVSFIDHYIGTMERQNLRLVYLIGGGILMVVGVMMLRSAKAALTVVESA